MLPVGRRVSSHLFTEQTAKITGWAHPRFASSALWATETKNRALFGLHLSLNHSVKDLSHRVGSWGADHLSKNQVTKSQKTHFISMQKPNTHRLGDHRTYHPLRLFPAREREKEGQCREQRIHCLIIKESNWDFLSLFPNPNPSLWCRINKTPLVSG